LTSGKSGTYSEALFGYRSGFGLSKYACSLLSSGYGQMSWQFQHKAALAAIICVLFAGPTLAKSSSSLTERIQIDATSELVFDSIRKYRTCELHHRHLVSSEGNHALIEENLQDVPLYGTVRCLWLEEEIPYKRIDYKMVKSDKFSSASGSYIILPSQASGSVTLELDSQFEIGLHLPFAREISQAAARKDMRTRLELIKNLSENRQIAAKP
jgi:hypothetical protein